MKGYVGKIWDAPAWLEYHPEDIPMDKENLAARARGYDDDHLKQLFAGICLRACVDYRAALDGKQVDGKDPAFTIEECEAFFQGETFQYLVGEMSLESIRKMIRATPPGAIGYLWKKIEINR